VASTWGDGIVEKLHTMKQRMEVLFSASFQEEQDETESEVDSVTAELKNGVLTVTVSRGFGSPTTPQKVRVRAG
jgi:hypothetical protein